MEHDRHQLVRGLGDPVPIEAQDLGRLLDRPEDRPGEHHRAHRVEAKLELGDDAEVAAAAANPPEEIGVLGRACLHELALRRDQVHGQEPVDCQPVLSLKPADAAPEREARDPGVGDDPAGCRQPELLGLAVELAPEHACLGRRGARLRIDADPLHRPQIDHDAAVADRQAGEAVAAAADRDLEPRLASESQRGDHVGHVGAAGDQRRGSVDRPVPDLAMLVVVGIRPTDELPLEAAFKLAQGCFVDPRHPTRIAYSGSMAPSACRARSLSESSAASTRRIRPSRKV